MKFNKTNFLKTASEYFQIAVGILLASIGLKAFLLPNGFLDGGVTGIAILINSKYQINTSLLLIGLSIPFLILAYYTLSKRIMIKSIISIACLAASIEIETFDIVTDDKLLISIFGGLFVGLGLGTTIRNGAVLDGSEILGVFLYDRLGIEIGKVVLTLNVILFIIAASVLSVETALYSILTYIVTANVSDYVIKGFEDFIGVMIVSKKSDQIETWILHKLGAGMTVYKDSKGYGSSGEMAGVNVIHTVINRIDLRKTHRGIEEIDPDAFIVEYKVNNIKGGVLRRYLERAKHRKTLSPDIVPNNSAVTAD